MGIASLILGIIALIVCVATVGVGGWLGAVLAIIGIILGALARKKDTGRGVATGGLVVSIIALVINLALFLACVACVGLVGSIAS